MLLAYVGLGVMGVVLGWFFASLVTLTVTLPLVKGQIPDGSSFPAKILLGYSLPLLGFNVVGLVQTWADVTLLYALTASLTSTGIYYIAVSSAAVLSIFWSPLAGAVFPALSSAHGKGDVMALERMLTTSIRVINVSVIPLSFSMAAVSPAVLHAVYGEAYIVGAAAFAIVASTLVIQAYAAIISTTLQAIGKTKTLLWVAVASTALEIMFLTLLAKPLGGVGAAVARVILFTASTTLGYMYLRGDVRLRFGENFIKSLALGLCVAAPLVMVDFYLVQYLPNMPLARIAVLAAVFTSLSTAAARKLGILSPADFSLLRQALPKPLHPSVNLAEKLFTRSRKGQG
ncbi:MAG: polysaccharide biosynthesis C-terminal domain-containing protein [Candidatus Caldarchaeum sp.]